jgi:carboxyl-terminal processing protease
MAQLDKPLAINQKMGNHMKKIRIVVFCCILVVVFAVGMGTGIFVQRQYLTVSKASVSEFQLVEKAWNIVSKNYVDQTATKPQTLAYATIDGMVNSLGDTGNSVFLTPEEVKQQNETQLQGIGLYVSETNGVVFIVAPVDGSPAQKAGLQPGDIILDVNGQPVTSMEEAASNIMGPAGTSVTLTIQSPAGTTSDITIVRATIEINSVTWEMLPGTSIADLRLDNFYQGTSTELDTALSAIKTQGATAIILDLRNNPGGLVNEAIGVASRFLNSGYVLEEKDASGKITKNAVLTNVTKTDLPLVVLVNQRTISAAEIVAGALQSQGRAKLIGNTTFGSGTIVNYFSLSDGSEIQLSVMEWLTPSGKGIWHVGLTPDVTVSLASEVDPLTPDTEKNLTMEQIEASGDQQLLTALILTAHNLL